MRKTNTQSVAMGLGLVLLLTTLFTQPVFAKPKVVVSIAPIHSLVASVMQGVAEPELLLEGGQSPHSISLSPSVRRKIAQADLIIWIAPTFELGLAKAVASQPQDQVITLLSETSIQTLALRDSGVWHEADHAHNESIDSHELPSASRADPHIWLDTNNAIKIIQITLQKLGGLDPSSMAIYQQNALKSIQKIQSLQQDNLQNLKGVKNKPYLVFHDAYQYFEVEQGLNAVGAVTLSPEQTPSLKALLAIKEQIQHQGVQCIFHEPQFRPKLVERIAEDTQIKLGVLDPLGADLKVGVGQWFALIGRLNMNLQACLNVDQQ
ncbi:MAG: zinc ABC transporter substrate-binding protein [Arenicellales bacterium]